LETWNPEARSFSLLFAPKSGIRRWTELNDNLTAEFAESAEKRQGKVKVKVKKGGVEESQPFG